MQPQKQYVHKTKWHKGSQSNWTGSHTKPRVVVGTQDLHPDTHRGTGYNSTWALRFTAGIRAHKQEKTRNQRSLTFKCSLATVGGFQKDLCGSILTRSRGGA